MTKAKKILIISVSALIIVIALLIFCLAPRTSVWDDNVRCYSINGADLSLSDDTSLEGMTDYMDIRCDFSISGPLFPAYLKGGSGTVTFNDTKYQVSSTNSEINNNWLSMSLTGEEFEMNKQLYVSPGGKYIMLFNPQKSEGEEAGSVYWIGPCGNIGELKDALTDFGLDFMIK